MDNSVHDSNYRLAANKKLRSIVSLEEPALVAIQKYARNKVLDAYFVYVSLLGNHEFYMVFLPLSYWLGYSEVTATLVDILSLGVYLTGIMKDYFGSPRPSSPPLERLTLSHHIALEFGFPSTHTCNAFSVSLYIILECINLQTTSSASKSLRLLIIILSIIYCFSVSFGRIYCGMHGFLDVGAGAALGIAITLLRYNFKDCIRNILLNLSFVNLLAAIMLLLVAIEKFPEPLTPCPCFKDCVSFLGVEMGLWLFAWLRPGRFGGDILDFQQMSSTKLIVRSVVGVALVLGWRISVSYIIKKVLSSNFAKSQKSQRSRPPQEFSSRAKSKLKNGCSRLDIAIKLFMYIGIGLTVTLVVPSVV